MVYDEVLLITLRADCRKTIFLPCCIVIYGFGKYLEALFPADWYILVIDSLETYSVGRLARLCFDFDSTKRHTRSNGACSNRAKLISDLVIGPASRD